MAVTTKKQELEALVEELKRQNQALMSQVNRQGGEIELLEQISDFRAGLAMASGVLERKAKLRRIAEEIKKFFKIGGVGVHVKKTQNGMHARHGEYDQDGLISYPYIMVPDFKDDPYELSQERSNTVDLAAYDAEPSQLYLVPENINEWLSRIKSPNKSKNFEELRQRVEKLFESRKKEDPHLGEVYKSVDDWFAKVHFPLRIRRPDGKLDVLGVIICDGFSKMPVPEEQVKFMQRRCDNEITPMLSEIIEMERNQELTLGQVVFEAILQDPQLLKGRRRQITALFGDLQSYTKQTDSLDAETTIDSLNVYNDIVLPIIIRYSGGLRPKLIGDGFFSFFNGLPSLPQEDNALRALRCARDISVAVRPLNERSGGIKYVVNFGVYSGPAAVGNIAGTQNLAWDFTAVGSTVNRASRVQGRARDGTILVAQASLDELKNNPELYKAFLEEFEQGTPIVLEGLKGIEGPITVYRVSARKQEIKK